MVATVIDAAVKLAGIHEPVAKPKPAIDFNPADYRLVAAWHQGSEAPMEDAFAAWQEAAAHLNAVGGTTVDSTEEHQRQWRAAALAEHTARRAVRMEPAYSLRALQTRAIAFVSDLHQEEPLLAQASRFADDYKAAMERDQGAAEPAHAFAAYSFARGPGVAHQS